MATFDPYHIWLGIPPEDQPPSDYRILAIPELESDPAVKPFSVRTPLFAVQIEFVMHDDCNFARIV